METPTQYSVEVLMNTLAPLKRLPYNLLLNDPADLTVLLNEYCNHSSEPVTLTLTKQVACKDEVLVPPGRYKFASVYTGIDNALLDLDGVVKRYRSGDGQPLNKYIAAMVDTNEVDWFDVFTRILEGGFRNLMDRNILRALKSHKSDYEHLRLFYRRARGNGTLGLATPIIFNAKTNKAYLERRGVLVVEDFNGSDNDGLQLLFEDLGAFKDYVNLFESEGFDAAYKKLYDQVFFD
jgi:hypothetical protein